MKLLIYPDSIHRKWKITKLKVFCEAAGIEVVTDKTKPFDRVIYWSYHKTFRPHSIDTVNLDNRHRMINFGCADIRKSKVENVMLQSFGYNAIINPEQSTNFLEKSELQGAHSLRICSKFEGYKGNCIYVKFLDGRIDEQTVRDYRIYVFGDKISLVVTKDKSVNDLFAGSLKSKMQCYYDPLELFTEKEIENILNFCSKYRVEVTELDAMRDSDGRLYIVDNNNIPAYSTTEKELFEADNCKVLKYVSNDLKEFLEQW